MVYLHSSCNTSTFGHNIYQRRKATSHLTHMLCFKSFMIHVIKLNSKFSVEIRELIQDKVSSSNFKSREALPLSLELCIYCTFDDQTHHHCLHHLTPLYRAYLYSWSPRILDCQQHMASPLFFLGCTNVTAHRLSK